MKKWFATFTALLVVCPVFDATAQAVYSERKIEITPYAGYVWTVGYEAFLGGRRGELDIGSGLGWGVSVAYNYRPWTQFELTYNRQDSDLVYRTGDSEFDVTGFALDYIQAGWVLGVDRGNRMGFFSFSLGTTHLVGKDEGVSDSWKFSMTFGLGTKIYLNDRFGIRIMGRAPWTFIGGDTEVICEEDGSCYTATGGRGLWQFDVTAGLIIQL